MNRIKIFSLTLVLSLVGVVSAAGGNTQATAQGPVKDQPSASCGLSGADCCKEGAGCCAKHKADHQNHSQQPAKAGDDNKESCCASGCAKHKADGQKAEGEACAMSQKEGANCCGGGEGSGCCAEGACQVADKQ